MYIKLIVRLDRGDVSEEVKLKSFTLSRKTRNVLKIYVQFSVQSKFLIHLLILCAYTKRTIIRKSAVLYLYETFSRIKKLFTDKSKC